MKQVIGVIDLVGSKNALSQLTAVRTLASVPFGGKYRLIDFILSSMVNSKIENVSILLKDKYRSLLDHIGQGKAWGLDRKRNGLFMLPPVSSDPHLYGKQGNLHHFHAHKDNFLRTTQDYVLIAPGHIVCNVDFRKMMIKHTETKADVTILYQTIDQQLCADTTELVLDETDMVRSVRKNSSPSLGERAVSMEIMLMKKSLFLELVETTVAKGGSDFFQDAIIGHAGQLNIAGCKEESTFGIVNTLGSYVHHSMKLLNITTRKALLYGSHGPIMTKGVDESPTRYLGDGDITNSLIAGGCTIEGAVENSILFPGVHVEKGAIVRNSILLPNCHVAPYATLENAILDKKVSIGLGKMIRGEGLTPFIAEKNSVI